MTQKGDAFLGLNQFDAAKECYESLRTLGDNIAADRYLKKLNDAQEWDTYWQQDIVLLKVKAKSWTLGNKKWSLEKVPKCIEYEVSRKEIDSSLRNSSVFHLTFHCSEYEYPTDNKLPKIGDCF